MAGPYQHIKHFVDFYGVDLRSSDVLRGRGFASDGTENCVHSPQGALTCRWGNHILASAAARYGLFAFEQTDITGASKRELVGIGNNLTDRAYRLVRSTFTLTNSGAAATVSHLYDEATSQFRFQIRRGATLVVDQALGVGTEGSPYMLSSLETVVDAASSLAMSTPTNASTSPAAFIEMLNAAPLVGTLSVAYWYWEVIPSGGALVSDFLQGDIFGTDAFTGNVSGVMLNGALYLAGPGWSGENSYLLKYDGNRIYRAGMPPKDGEIVDSSGLTSPQSVTDDVRGNRTITSATDATVINYRHRYVNIDKAGNRVEGVPQDTGTGSTTTNKILATNFSLGTQMDTGAFNRGFAIASSTTTSATLPVSSGHTMQAGDIAYFWNAATGVNRFNQRLVTSTTATTVVVSTASLDSDPTSLTYDPGGTPRILQNAVITNNSRIAIYRRHQANGLFYFVDEIPNIHVNSALNAYTYYDSLSNDALVLRDALLEETFAHDLPPINCGQVSGYNGGLILSGDFRKPNVVHFSDVDGPEYFPQVTHNFELQSAATGHAQSGEFLVIGTSLALYVTSGILSEFNFRLDQIGKNVGIQSHLSMREIGEGVLAFSSNVGPMVLVSGRDLQPLGALEYPDGSKVSRLEPFWTRKWGSADEKPVFSRAVSAVLPDDRLYLLFVPYEDPARPGFATANSVVWVYDYGRGAWWKWTGWNCAGGLALFENQLYFSSRSHNGSVGIGPSNIVTRLYQEQRSPDLGEYIYGDHDQTIPWVFRSHWESLGQPALLKKFLRYRITSEEERIAASTPMTVSTYLNRNLAAPAWSTDLTWTNETELKDKIGQGKCRRFLIEFSHDVRYDPMIISGYELEASANFRPEMKE